MIRFCKFVFLLFLGQITHKVAYRRQTNNILLRHVGFIWLVLACCKHTILKKSKFRKICFIFFWKNIKKNNNKKSISMKKITLYKKLFIGLSAFKKKYQIKNSIQLICFFLPFCAKLTKLAKNPKTYLFFKF